jgi:superfamily II DNA or RNA helicase/HKD family nuclease
MDNFISSLKDSLHNGFIDHTYSNQKNFNPQLLVNNHQENTTVLQSLLEELEVCQSFIFSVAFITESGLATLKTVLYDLAQRGIKGRILTSTFLQFNSPKAFRELLKIPNVDVKLTDLPGFHAKGYIFHHETHHTLVIGSSNLTAQALQVNYEWNVKLTSHQDGEIIRHFSNQFDDVWDKAFPLTEEWIEKYAVAYEESKEKRAVEKVIELPADYRVNTIQDALSIEPNKMQEAALAQIQAVRDAGHNKGLVISATGTGKTFLSAFDVRSVQPGCMLFIVHREQILQKAMSDYKKILGGHDEQFGIFSGSSREIDRKYVFATIQTLSKQENLVLFEREAFDYVLIDEVHKAGAKSYQRVIDYFEPTFMLGMTATPERMDDFNIYELFDYNIAYEIRLQEALEEDMLSPFHYYGVTDIEYNGELISDTAMLAHLVTDERINHIIEKVNYYGYSGESVKGLIFCSRKEETHQLANALNERGYRTCALTGDDSQEVRISRVEQLESGELDYILTVDIFNEGIDIPSINQVVMLRQTASSIIFIQQLGRGLRKHNSKEYVTIIDFIGNYKNNYLIPVALSGESSQNKDTIRRRMKNTDYIKGISTVNFEEIARKQIYKSISDSKLTAMKTLKDAYTALRNRLGRIPYLQDFILNHSIDPEVLVKAKDNYHLFLAAVKEEVPPISDYENRVLTMVSQELLNGKRLHEVLLLEMLSEHEEISYEEYRRSLADRELPYDDKTITSVLRIFDLSFFSQTNRKKYGDWPFVIVENHTLKLRQELKDSITNNDTFSHLLKDVLATSKEKNKRYGNNILTRYEKYTRKDACRLLNWDSDESSTIYGYKTKHQTCPIFVTYHKDEDVESSVAYDDTFLNEQTFKWFTRSKRTTESKEVAEIIDADQNDIDIHLFVKKDDDEGIGFYYLGQVHPDKQTVQQEEMRNGEDKVIPVVTMNMVLEEPVDKKIYRYIVE